MKVKIFISVFVILGSVGYLVYTTLSSGEALEYFKHVDEVAREPSKYRGLSLKLHGNVVKQSIIKKKNMLDFRFALFRDKHWVEVYYTGIVPDAFGDCAEIVVKGKLSDQRTFSADSISAKCPSKYDEQRQTTCGQAILPLVLAYRNQQNSTPR
jgi:cytochrome c-type biogenesis protein CcmE